MSITKAAVIGAGSMGGGIAAHLANAGVEVILFDMTREQAQAGIERQLKSRGFFLPDFAERLTPASIEEDAHLLAEAQWIVEAVFEKLEVKHSTFATIAANRTSGTPVSSNTSTIPLAELTEGMDEDLRRDFLITHFFNPPRVMRLVELVAGPDTRPEVVEQLREFCERDLGKVCIDCRDTPGFVANRVGNFWMAAGAAIALRDGITPELADSIYSKPFGVPRTGIFGLFDYVGLQLVPMIWGSLLNALPETDAYHRFDITKEALFTQLLEKELYGRSTKAGVYRNRGAEVFDPEANDYRPAVKLDDPALAAKTARQVMKTNSPAGRYATEVFLTTLEYCATNAEDILGAEGTIDAIDAAMVHGYGWKQGPFALADSIGVEWLAGQFDKAPALLSAAVEAGGFYPQGKVMRASGAAVERNARTGVVSVAELVDGAEVLIDEEAAAVYKLDSGIGILTLRTPMNSLSVPALGVLEKAAELDLKALVVANDEARAFSAGADLATLAGLSAKKDRHAIEDVFRAGTRALGALRSAPFPTVGAARGVALGGGLELSLHLDALAIHAETRVGFPEPSVGLIPAWGGTVRYLELLVAAGVENPHRVAFEFINAVTPTAGAYDAKQRHFLRENDRIVMNVDYVVAEALDLAESLVEGYTAPVDGELPLTSEELTWDHGTGTDKRIAQALANVYTGEGSITVEEMLSRERAEAGKLLMTDESAARAEHMAKTRRPLNN